MQRARGMHLIFGQITGGQIYRENIYFFDEKYVENFRQK